MEYNILKLKADRAGRIYETENLSLNQCSTNNRLLLEYEGDYDYIEVSFRKPDGWLSDKLTLTKDSDLYGNLSAYIDIEEEFTSFIMGGRNAILVANIYFHSTIDSVAKISTVGNLRINVNYVDDALVHTNYSQTYINALNSQIGAIQNDITNLKTGTVLIGKAYSDQYGNVIDLHYETKADSKDKFDYLNDKKLDKQAIADQSTRLQALENDAIESDKRLDVVESLNESQSTQIQSNKKNIEQLSLEKVSTGTLDTKMAERVIAEANLQKQIDELSASQNFKDIVGTKTDLFTLDTSNFNIGDKVQVLQDSAYAMASTVYRWTGNSWEYVGKYSTNSYTKTEVDSLITNVRATVPNKIKQDSNKLYLYADSQKIANQDNPISFKTIDGVSILGTGNISTDRTDSALDLNSTNPIQNKIVAGALNLKADKSTVSELTNVVSNKADASALERKQNKLTAGSNITILDDGTISADVGIKFKKVDTLPLSGESGYIYLLAEGNGKITEYIWVNATWEVLGYGELEFADYYKKAEVENLLSNKASKKDLETVYTEVSSNKVAIAGKADATTTNNSLVLLNNAVSQVIIDVDNKADKTELENYATKLEIPDITTKQDRLISGENIKTINGVNILGSGDLLLADTEVVDLDLYAQKEAVNNALALKADKTEVITDYNQLQNLPNLDEFASYSEMKLYVQGMIDSIPDPDLSDYYTKDEVDEAIKNVEVDLTGYATETYVNTTVDEAIAGVIGAAPETFDTFKEVADYIASDKTGAAAMTASIQQNANDIEILTNNISGYENRIAANEGNINRKILFKDWTVE